MATYNGESSIERQLNSILPQLTEDDEVIVVDDCSTDKTVQLINSMKNNRSIPIHIFLNTKNMGPIKSFERAISYSTKDFIFLSDQDDEWFPDKVSIVIKEFKTTNCDLVVHDAIVVDGENNVLDISWNHFNKNNVNQRILGNIFKNAFTGCMMAFSKSLVSKILPFPEKIDMHDQWIALIAMKCNLRISIIESPLMFYVRHGKNATGIERRTISEMILGRYNTIKPFLLFKQN